MQIIKDRAVVADDVLHLADDEAAPAAGRYTVSLARWQKEQGQLAAAGVRLAGADAVAAIAADLPKLELVVLEFAALADGRGFSQARLLRDRYHYQGEVRARGDFIRDQMYFLARVGVNAFEPVHAVDLASLLPALAEFSVNYQAAVGQPPLYRRRG